MPLLRRVRTLAAAIETTPGTAETLDAADGAFNVYNAIIQPSIDTETREGQGGFGYLNGVPGGRMGTATFRTDLHVGASQPNWASIFLPACGWVGTSIYTPRSEALGTNVKSLTLGLYENGLLKQLRGAVGTFQIVLPTGRMGYIDWTFTGVWDGVTDTAIIEPVYPTTLPLRAAGGTVTYGGVAQKVESVTIDAGNSVIMREDPNVDEGYISGLVTNRLPIITANPEAELVATEDRYGDWISRSEGAWAYSLDGPNSSQIVIDAPAAQIFNAQEGDRNDLQTDEMTWNCNKDGATQDQELIIAITPEV